MIKLKKLFKIADIIKKNKIREKRSLPGAKGVAIYL